MEDASRLKTDYPYLGKLVDEAGVEPIRIELEILLSDSKVSPETALHFFIERLENHLHLIQDKKKSIERLKSRLLWVIGGLLTSWALYYFDYNLCDIYIGPIGRIILAGFGGFLGGPIFVLIVDVFFPSLGFYEEFETHLTRISRLVDRLREHHEPRPWKVKDIG